MNFIWWDRIDDARKWRLRGLHVVDFDDADWNRTKVYCDLDEYSFVYYLENMLYENTRLDSETFETEIK